MDYPGGKNGPKKESNQTVKPPLQTATGASAQPEKLEVKKRSLPAPKPGKEKESEGLETSEPEKEEGEGEEDGTSEPDEEEDGGDKLEVKKRPLQASKQDEEESEEEEADKGDPDPETKPRGVEVKMKFPVAIPTLDKTESLGWVKIGSYGKLRTLEELADYELYEPQEGELVVAEAIFQAKKFEFESNDAWKAELQLRAGVIQAIATLNTIKAAFARENTWSLPSESWASLEIVGSSRVTGAFTPRTGTDASTAIDAIFSSSKMLYLDCSVGVVIAYYKGLLQALGKKPFDKRTVIICPAGVEKVKYQGKETPVPFYAQEMEQVTLATVEDLIPGDRVYFQNFPEYEDSHKKTAPWAGEYMIYAGRERYVGFGLEGALTAEEVQGELIKGYQKDLLPGKKALTKPATSSKSLTGVWPGLHKEEIYRFKNPVTKEVLK